MFVTLPSLRYAVAAEADGGSVPAAPEATEPDAQTPDATQPEPGDDFDAARAMDKIRKANAEAKALRDRAKAAEDAKAAALTEVETAKQEAAQVPTLKAQLLRAEVALELGLPASLAKRLVGGTRDELLADAEELLATVTPAAKGSKASRPVESLAPGSGPTSTGPSLDQQIAAAQKAGDWRAVIALQNSKLSP